MTSIYDFPVTKESATFVVGNPEIVGNIIGPTEAYAQLKKDDNTLAFSFLGISQEALWMWPQR
ncbi:MAG: hypothetical protein MGG37_01735 [Trichodesmium sp. MAG_R01]|nr:hypothetical protein [Trichodesmium sp. MAG_R01]